MQLFLRRVIQLSVASHTRPECAIGRTHNALIRHNSQITETKRNWQHPYRRPLLRYHEGPAIFVTGTKALLLMILVRQLCLAFLVAVLSWKFRCLVISVAKGFFDTHSRQRILTHVSTQRGLFTSSGKEEFARDTWIAAHWSQVLIELSHIGWRLWSNWGRFFRHWELRRGDWSTAFVKRCHSHGILLMLAPIRRHLRRIFHIHVETCYCAAQLWKQCWNFIDRLTRPDLLFKL